jgi:hypothetical protein
MFEIGKTYKIDHQRKGVFTIRVESQNEDTVTGIITSGFAGAMMAYNEKDIGDKISLRKSMITIL